MIFHDMTPYRNTIHWRILPILLLFAASCAEEKLPCCSDPTVIGKEICVDIPVDFPQMDVQTRSDMTDGDLNSVKSLWIATFNASTGAMTTEGWQNKTALPNTSDVHTLRSVSIKTLSGPSYIVAVANVTDNMGVTPDNLTPRPLSELLSDDMTWDDFLRIGVVSPSSQTLVNAPNPPLAMAGAYTNIAVGDPHTPQRPLSEWQTENFTPYTIPYNENGTVSLTDGAIHMRRLVSQIRFNILPGKTGDIDMKLTPHYYRVVNVPRFSWLYERRGEAEGSVSNYGANFGDICDEDNAASFYWNSADYTSNNIQQTEAGHYSFNFWQGENKHEAITEISDYDGRDAEYTTPLPGINPDSGQNIQTATGTGLFTPLTGGTWISNNMATYVVISCTVDYADRIGVNQDGEITENGTEVQRTGDAVFLIHLGYMNGDSSDFNCYRNTQYTYNLTVNGVNDIRVEAFHGSETPGVSGMVADVESEFLNLDCHYNAYNIELSDEELSKYDATTNRGFGFIMTTYDSGAEKSYTEESFIDRSFDQLSASEKQYLDWVELRPTTGKDVIADYKPRADGNDTFNLADASRGIRDDQKSQSGWYTVFVREYTYEATNADESVFSNDKPIWHRYVFANPRRFYIRTTKAVSSDGQSMYTRAKYAAMQRSIMSYYDQNSIPESSATGKVRGSAIGVEAVNETYGLNMRQSYSGDNADNGRLNCWNYYNRNNQRLWSSNIGSGFQMIKESDNYGAGIKAAAFPVAALAPYTGNLDPNIYDPQRASGDRADYIEAINACMNRNRDNNGNGTIDIDELRWYVPAMGKYLRMLIGQDALEPNELVDFASMPNRPTAFGDNGLWGRYLFYGSDGKVLWAMEGMSVSDYNTYCEYPWQVRCIRNLGTNLGVTVANDPTIPAYSFIPNDAQNIKRGGRVEMTYYQATTMRNNAYNGNGTGAGRMPVHLISDPANSLYRYGFEIYEGDESNGTISAAATATRQGWTVLTDNINDRPADISSSNNPCTRKGDRWRLPNVKELAIMRNLGVISGGSRYVSCSVGVITGNGIKITNVTDQATTNGQAYNGRNGNTHYFMNTIETNITQNEQNSYQVRCVRDYVP